MDKNYNQGILFFLVIAIGIAIIIFSFFSTTLKKTWKKISVEVLQIFKFEVENHESKASEPEKEPIHKPFTIPSIEPISESSDKSYMDDEYLTDKLASIQMKLKGKDRASFKSNKK